jgi:uncharacterized protein (DUF983 family)
MLKKGTRLNSILTGSCPKCHEESMYLDKNPFNLGNIYKMHEKCSHCDLKYNIEPSFFYGAMYVSYGLGCALSIATFIISFVIFGSSVMTSFIAIVIVLIVCMPLTMRLARNIWINMFISFDKNWKEHKKTT